jgi:hypothetical protein
MWVKKEIIDGHPVVSTVFANEYLIEGKKDPMAGSDEYDHIVPMSGITADSALLYSNDDKLTFSDNGLYATSPESAQYMFTRTFGKFPRDRKAANYPKGAAYSLPKVRRNYGTSISGVKDLNGDTIPVRLTTSVNLESPEMVNGQTDAPKPSPLTLHTTVTIPDQTVAYNLYLFNDFTKVPDSNFNAHAADAFKTWSIPAGQGSTFSVDISIMSNEIAAFRAVRTSAP